MSTGSLPSRPLSYERRDPRKRPILYVYQDPDERNCFWFHGISFAEFHAAMKPDRALVILSAINDLDDVEEDWPTFLSYVEVDNLKQLAKQDIYRCGDFVWVDAVSVDALNSLSDQEVAGLFLLGHTSRLLGSPFSAVLKNRFVYLGHDDGWRLKLYARQLSDVAKLLEAIVAIKARQSLRKKVFTDGIGSKLLRLSRSGVLLDFRDPAGDGSAQISTPGAFRNMDDLLNNVTSEMLAPIATLDARAWRDLKSARNRALRARSR